jgi:translation elongation factor EF-1beta
LKTLSDPEKEVVAKEYNIIKNTFTPSAFGANKLCFNPKIDVHVENEADYFNEISQEIQNKL